MSSHVAAVPRWVRTAGAASVALVALVAAIVSYSHMHEVAARADEGWRAWLVPLSVDGLLVGSSLILYSRRRSSWLTWASLAVGLLVSLAANLAAASPGLVPHIVAAWPAVALGLSYETLLTLVRQSQAASGNGVEIAHEPLVDEAPPAGGERPGPTQNDKTCAATVQTTDHAPVANLGRTRAEHGLGIAVDDRPGLAPTPSDTATQTTSVDAEPARPIDPTDRGPVRVGKPRPVHKSKPDRSTRPTRSKTTARSGRSDDELLHELRKLTGPTESEPPSMSAVRGALRVGTGRANRLLDRLKNERRVPVAAGGHMELTDQQVLRPDR